MGNTIKDKDAKFPTVKEGSKISVIVSKGQEKVKVPKVAGMEKDEAIRALEEAKLKAEVVEDTSKTIEEGIVISQDTEADTEAFAGDTVKIHVSKGTGIKQVDMVSVIGQTEDAARSTLEGLNLKVNIAYDEDSSKNNGVVLKQSVDAGKKVNEGTTVTLTVNKLAEMKQGTVTVNLKSLLNYTPPTDSEEEGTTKIEKARVKIVVGSDTIYNEEKEKTTTNITANFSGKGNVTIKVYADDILKGTKEINLNTTTTCVFE